MAATDTFSSAAAALDSPAVHAFAVTPNDSTDLANATRGVFVGTSGNMQVNMVGGETSIIFYSLAAGICHPLRLTRIWATNTTAANITAVY